MRAILDVNVVISGLLSAGVAPGRLLRAWDDGAFELVASPALLDQLARALAYPKLRRLIPSDEAAAALEWIRSSAELVDDPTGQPPLRSPDPGDDYLVALAVHERVPVVSGDSHLLGLADTLPILTPVAFLELVEG